MKSLKESILDVDDNIENSHFEDPKYFRDEIKAFKLSGGFLKKNIGDIISLCDTIEAVGYPTEPDDSTCQKILDDSFIYMLGPQPKDNENAFYIIRMLCNIMNEVKGNFCSISPLVKNGRSAYDKYDYKRIELYYEDELTYKDVMKLNKISFVKSSFSPEMLTLMDTLGMITKKHTSCKNVKQYVLIVHNTGPETSFRVMWLPKGISSKSELLIKIMMDELQ